jgi:hypothetical protein
VSDLLPCLSIQGGSKKPSRVTTRLGSHIRFLKRWSEQEGTYKAVLPLRALRFLASAFRLRLALGAS